MLLRFPRRPWGRLFSFKYSRTMPEPRQLHGEQGIVNPAERANKKLKRQVRDNRPHWIDNDLTYKSFVSNARLRRQIGEEVEEAMRMPPDPHDAITESYTRPTRIIRNPFDPYKTQPLGEEE